MIAVPVKCAVILFDISVCGIQTVAVCLAESLKLDVCCESKQSSQWDSPAKLESLETNINISVV